MKDFKTLVEKTKGERLSKMNEALKSNIDSYEEVTHKTFNGSTLSKFHTEEGQREFIATITTNQVDRDGDVIDPKGIDIKNFLANPVIMLNHESWELPIGQAMWTRRFSEQGKSGILAKGRITGKTDRGNEAFGLMQDGILTQTSIGFGIKQGGAREPTPDESKSFPGIKRMITKSELFEFSIVGIPANTDAVISQVSKMANVPDWLGLEVADVNLKGIEEEAVELEEAVTLVAPVELNKHFKMERVLTETEIADQAKKNMVDLHEVTVLGKV